MSINWEDYEEPLKKPKNPLVLIGCGVTAGVLFAGLVAFKKGNQGLSQKMMRARVIAQGATVALMVASSGGGGGGGLKVCTSAWLKARVCVHSVGHLAGLGNSFTCFLHRVCSADIQEGPRRRGACWGSGQATKVMVLRVLLKDYQDCPLGAP
ncbi:RING-H2 finger protein ATL48 [Auxenochlorella protothecoides]|uniref:RING-H2 finger protein ATL48 n=1 Tax=Auxenochlorella protothecoides TaxID=3075 RepID=A0A087SDU9_AUXPR|nr:RING-H2 finger protein ATL48 [Auxenochlorella protothecoides]KFM23903.1 RING-H2 finger protein ATL48 [Auxenochlorella protothecoides]